MFKFGFSLLLVGGVLIGMPLHGEFPIRLFQVIVLGVPVYLKNLVVIHAHAFLGILLLLLLLLPYLISYCLLSGSDSLSSVGRGFLRLCLYVKLRPRPPELTSAKELRASDELSNRSEYGQASHLYLLHLGSYEG